jgi:hypothetical protein
MLGGRLLEIEGIELKAVAAEAAALRGFAPRQTGAKVTRGPLDRLTPHLPSAKNRPGGIVKAVFIL